MNIVSAILGSVGLASIIFMLGVLARFGHKLGAVTKMRPYYRGYYVAMGFVALAFVVRLVRAAVFWAPSANTPAASSSPLFYLFLYHLPLAIGLTIGLAITWHYWSWLLKER